MNVKNNLGPYALQNEINSPRTKKVGNHCTHNSLTYYRSSEQFYVYLINKSYNLLKADESLQLDFSNSDRHLFILINYLKNSSEHLTIIRTSYCSSL